MTQKKPSQVIALANQKGGVGKTTTTVNLAACLAEAGQHVLLIDLDPQANATSALGIEKKAGQSVYQALLGNGALHELPVSTVIPNLDLIPSELDLAGAEVDIARSENYLHCFRDAIQPLRTLCHYNFILIDCPPSLGILTCNALAAAQAAIIPVQSEYLALEGLGMISRVISQISQNGSNPELQISGIVMTMFDNRTNLASQVWKEVLQHFGALVYQTRIPRSIRLSEAPSHGLPIILYDPKSTGAQAYRELAVEFLQRHNAPLSEKPVENTPAEAQPPSHDMPPSE